MKKPEQKVLIYDIETTLLMGYFFSLMKNFMRHNQLLKGYFSRTHIICITYRWAHEKKSRILTWGNSIEDEKAMIIKFDKLIQEADVVIGKNSDRFDNLHINSQRLWFDLPGNPNWTRETDDLEKQMRKHFYLPSHSLDYISEQLGLGGKRGMEFGDWVAIVEYRMIQCTGCTTGTGKDLIEFLTGKKVRDITRSGKAALKKMFDYGMKDSDDTMELWNYCFKHFNPRTKHINKIKAIKHNRGFVCDCGSDNVKLNGTRTVGGQLRKALYCNDCNKHCGYAAIKKDGSVGKQLVT